MKKIFFLFICLILNFFVVFKFAFAMESDFLKKQELNSINEKTIEISMQPDSIFCAILYLDMKETLKNETSVKFKDDFTLKRYYLNNILDGTPNFELLSGIYALYKEQLRYINNVFNYSKKKFLYRDFFELYICLSSFRKKIAAIYEQDIKKGLKTNDRFEDLKSKAQDLIKTRKYKDLKDADFSGVEFKDYYNFLLNCPFFSIFNFNNVFLEVFLHSDILYDFDYFKEKTPSILGFKITINSDGDKLKKDLVKEKEIYFRLFYAIFENFYNEYLKNNDRENSLQLKIDFDEDGSKNFCIFFYFDILQYCDEKKIDIDYMVAIFLDLFLNIESKNKYKDLSDFEICKFQQFYTSFVDKFFNIKKSLISILIKTILQINLIKMPDDLKIDGNIIDNSSIEHKLNYNIDEHTFDDVGFLYEEYIKSKSLKKFELDGGKDIVLDLFRKFFSEISLKIEAFIDVDYVLERIYNDYSYGKIKDRLYNFYESIDNFIKNFKQIKVNKEEDYNSGQIEINFSFFRCDEDVYNKKINESCESNISYIFFKPKYRSNLNNLQQNFDDAQTDSETELEREEKMENIKEKERKRKETLYWILNYFLKSGSDEEESSGVGKSSDKKKYLNENLVVSAVLLNKYLSDSIKDIDEIKIMPGENRDIILQIKKRMSVKKNDIQNKLRLKNRMFKYSRYYYYCMYEGVYNCGLTKKNYESSLKDSKYIKNLINVLGKGLEELKSLCLNEKFLEIEKRIKNVFKNSYYMYEYAGRGINPIWDIAKNIDSFDTKKFSNFIENLDCKIDLDIEQYDYFNKKVWDFKKTNCKPISFCFCVFLPTNIPYTINISNEKHVCKLIKKDRLLKIATDICKIVAGKFKSKIEGFNFNIFDTKKELELMANYQFTDKDGRDFYVYVFDFFDIFDIYENKIQNIFNFEKESAESVFSKVEDYIKLKMCSYTGMSSIGDFLYNKILSDIILYVPIENSDNAEDPLFLANKAEMNNLSFKEYNNRNKIDFYFSIAGYSHFLFIFKEIVKKLYKISFEFSKNSIYFSQRRKK